MVQTKNSQPASLGDLKAALMQQILNNSDEFVEAWKQDYRNKKAQVLKHRREVLSDLLNFEKKEVKLDFSGKTVEEIKQAAMLELKQKSKATITEEWKNKVINDKVATLNSRHQVMNEIAAKKSTKNACKDLTPVSVNSNDKRGDLLASIRKRAANDSSIEVIPAWKETEMKTKRCTMENKREMLSEFEANKNQKSGLKNTDDFVVKRAKLMESVRGAASDYVVVESWKQENRNNIANPVIYKQQMMMDLITKNHKALNCTKSPRELLLEALNTAEDFSAPLEAWRVNNNKIRSEAIRNKHSIICDINEKKGATKMPEANRTNLLAAIREAVNQKNIDAPVVESWRQEERDNKSNLMVAKKLVLVDVEQPKARALKPVEKSESKLHAELMNQIRTEKIPAWKEAITSTRVNAIQNKNNINLEINADLAKNLKNNNSVAENKINLMKDVRAKAGNFTEAWKESQCNDRAVIIGCKKLINNELNKNSSKNLNSTKSQAELKNDALKELRLKADTAIPQWKEEILDSQSEIQGNRQKVIYELSFCKKDRSPLTATKSLNQVKNQVLAEIRRPVPVEAWKEEQRNKIAELYTNKREINDVISGKKFELECARSQSELRNDLLREIRSKNLDEVVPVWKEKKMMKRTEVHTNKVELNRCIESLNL